MGLLGGSSSLRESSEQRGMDPRVLEMMRAQLLADIAPREEQQAPVTSLRGATMKPALPPQMMGPPPSAPMMPEPPASMVPASPPPIPAPSPGTFGYTPPVAAPLPPSMTPQAPAIQAAPAVANINNTVTMPTQTFNPAQQRPQLPSFANLSLAPSTGYSPAPQIPGYGMPRTGTPFRAPQPQAPQPFAAPIMGDIYGQPQAADLYGGGQGGPSLYARYGLPFNLA